MLSPASLSPAILQPQQPDPIKTQGPPGLSRSTGGDTVQFGRSSRQALFKKYGIENPEKVQVIGPKLKTDKSEVLYRLLQAHEQALKGLALHNFSGRSFACNVLLENGQWGVGSNFERTRDKALCGERDAMSNARSKALERLSTNRLQSDPEYRKTAKAGMNNQILAMSGKELDQGVSPCADCQGWLAENPHITPQTQLVDLRRHHEDGKKLYIRVRQVKDLLPLAANAQPSMSEKPLSELPLKTSPQGGLNLAKAHLNQKMIREVLDQAKEAYEGNSTASLSGKNMGAAVRLLNGKTAQGARFDITARWHTDAAMNAATRALQENPGEKMTALALYGEDKVPAPELLGKLAQPEVGSRDTLIITIEDEAIQVRTIGDYIKALHISGSSQRKKS